MKILDKIINDLNKKISIAIGCFDGIHIGHQQVIKKILEKKEVGMLPAVFTFSENPKFMNAGEKGKNIILLDEKHKILSDIGVSVLYNIDFLTIKNLSPQEFVKDILVKRLKVGHVACGFNFSFGYKGGATVQDLKNLCEIYNIEVDIVEPVLYRSLPVSSTEIRKAIKLGDIKRASELLGRPLLIKSSEVK